MTIRTPQIFGHSTRIFNQSCPLTTGIPIPVRPNVRLRCFHDLSTLSFVGLQTKQRLRLVKYVLSRLPCTRSVYQAPVQSFWKGLVAVVSSLLSVYNCMFVCLSVIPLARQIFLSDCICVCLPCRPFVNVFL